MGAGKIIVGILALLGVLLVLNWGWEKYAAVTPTKSAQASLVDAFGNTVVGPAPCVAPALPTLSNCSSECSAPGGAALEGGASRNDLFPGSYTNFGLYNTGCDGSRRRC